MANTHVTVVVRIPPDHYEMICETCGTLLSRPAQKPWLEAKAKEHMANPGAPVIGGSKVASPKAQATTATPSESRYIKTRPMPKQPAKQAQQQQAASAEESEYEPEVVNSKTHGHDWERLNICALCEGPLRIGDGSYRQTYLKSEIVSFCSDCYSHINEEVSQAT